MTDTTYRPLVAVVGYHLAPGRVTRWPDGGYGVPGPYLDALRRFGARTLIVSPGETNDPEEILAPFDGLMLVGGGDVDPALYGAEPDVEHNYGVEPDRDRLEIDLLLAADRMHVPTLAICRGMQIMNVAFGGTLHQHVPDMPGMLEHGVPVADTVSTHEVKAVDGSRLLATAGVDVLSCSSHHHQSVDRVGDRLAATAWSDDGLVEAIELQVDDPYADTWMLGVQWHPEDTAAADPAQQAIFDGFALVSKWRGSRAKPGETHGRSSEYGIVDYDPAWPAWFEEEAGSIRAALGRVAVKVDHVGSTSVPGLAAKAVIDIQVSVTTLIPRADVVDPLVATGYRHSIDPIETEHEFLSKGYDDGDARRVHIHLCEVGSEWERRHLAFRDYLRTHDDAAATYAALKRRLAAEHPRDIQAYVDGKTAFIRSTEARALADT
ncbi:MAG: gamma-glutamyl-gamma-aminobutyrate hydrolase family protein [Actinomycetota bacterium]